MTCNISTGKNCNNVSVIFVNIIPYVIIMGLVSGNPNLKLVEF